MDLLTFDTIDDRPVDEEPYDWTARVIGQGLPTKAGVYPLPYLYAGHGLLLICLLISCLINYPGFPLTEVPEEYQSLLLQVSSMQQQAAAQTSLHNLTPNRLPFVVVRASASLSPSTSAPPRGSSCAALPRRSRSRSSSGASSASSSAVWRSASSRRRCRCPKSRGRGGARGGRFA